MDAWERIELWLKSNCPEAFADLAKPATDAKLTDMEAKLAIKLPADAVNTYRKHDGQMGMGPPIAGAWKFLPLKSVAVQWNIQRKLLEEGAFATATARAKGLFAPFGGAPNGYPSRTMAPATFSASIWIPQTAARWAKSSCIGTTTSCANASLRA